MEKDCNEVIISLASNHQQEQNLSEARHRLGQILFNIQYTQELWTEPYKATTTPSACGNSIPHYLNQLVYAETRLSVEELTVALKTIEADMGRTAEQRLNGIVCIDLDLMEYNGSRYHLPDWQRPYIKALLK